MSDYLRNNKIKQETYSDVTLDINRDIWPILANILTVLAISYFAIHPEAFIIVSMDIISLPPKVLLNFFAFAMPVALSVYIARTLTFLWDRILPYPIVFVLLLIFSPVILFDRLLCKSYLGERILKWLEDYKDQRDKKKKTRKFKLSNLIFFFFSIVFLFSFYFWNNPISNTWLSSNNRGLLLNSYTHYYCQITGSYNTEECTLWNNKLSNYKMDDKKHDE